MKFVRFLSQLLLISLALTATAEGFTHQKRQTTRPVRRTLPAPPTSLQPTFETLLGADSYKIYVEVRSVGQFIRSDSIHELIEPLTKLAFRPQELTSLITWLNNHADAIMTSRMFVATWATANDLPEVLIAIELDSPDEAAKFAQQLNSLLPKILASPVVEKPNSNPTEKGDETATKSKPPKPSYYLEQAGQLLLISPTRLSIKKLRPGGSKLLAEDTNFRLARSRFGSEQLFIFVNVDQITREEEERSKQAEEGQKNREAELAATAQAAENGAPTGPAETAPKFDPQEGPPRVPDYPQPGNQPSPPAEPDALSTAIEQVANNFFSTDPHWPSAIGAGLSFGADSFDVRALLISTPGEKCDAIPFFPNLIPGASIVPASPSVVPADTEVFVSLSVDLPKIYASISQPVVRSSNFQPGPVDEPKPADPFANLEKDLKIKIADDLLPLLGSEIGISVPIKLVEGGPSPPPEPSPSAEPSETAGNDLAFVLSLSLKDKEGMKRLLPKIVESLGFKGASTLAHTEYREDTELVSYGNAFSYAFIEDFLIISPSATATRHVVDSYLKGETLSSDPQFKNYTRWHPRQLQAQLYISPALMESYKDWINQPGTQISDQTRELFSRLSLVAQPVTYSLTNDGLGTLHELRVPRDLVLMAVANLSAESNPPPLIANERFTVGALYMLAYVESQYRAGEGQGSFGSLDRLIAHQMVSRDLIENHGYKVQLIVLGNRFEITAVPTEYGKTGKTSYYIDETNILRGADRSGGIATAADRPVQ